MRRLTLPELVKAVIVGLLGLVILSFTPNGASVAGIDSFGAVVPTLNMAPHPVLPATRGGRAPWATQRAAADGGGEWNHGGGIVDGDNGVGPVKGPEGADVVAVLATVLLSMLDYSAQYGQLGGFWWLLGGAGGTRAAKQPQLHRRRLPTGPA